MYKLCKAGVQANIQLREYVVDALSDLSELPASDPFGSVALVIETGEIYVKNSSGEWVKYPSAEYVKPEDLATVAFSGLFSDLIGKPSTRTVTLTAVGWDSTELTQTVTVTGVTATNDIDVASAPTDYEAYGKAGIYAITQAADSVTFKCKKVPEDNITVFVRIWEG